MGLRALEFIHFHEIIHRDIKPQNILLTSCGRIKVTDFGGAMDVNTKPFDDTLFGTAEYISPEALLGSKILPSVDIWGYGCILYEILLGTTPFYNPSHYVIFHSVIGYARGTHNMSLPELEESTTSFLQELLQPDCHQRLGFK